MVTIASGPNPPPRDPSKTRIELRNLVPGYTTRQRKNAVFDSLSLSLFSNELVCLLGPNGSGKSTLLRTIAGLQKPLSGDVIFPSNRHAATQLAVVLTDPVKVSNMTVRELIAYGRYPYLSWNIQLQDADLRLIESAIDRVNLRDLADRPLDELSDGQRQMAMIARALAQDTPILLLDEPTAHLDLRNRVRMLTFLKELAATADKAILMATHELDLALQTADVLWVAHDCGITHGIPEDLMLDGVLESIFAIDGYDIGSGKIERPITTATMVNLSGGSARDRMWTKNALERKGIQVTENSGIAVRLETSGKRIWYTEGKEVHSLSGLLDLFSFRH